MSLNFGPKATEQAGAHISHPYETVGLATALNRHLILGKGLLRMSAFHLALERADTIMEDKVQLLEGGRMGHMLPKMPRARSCAVEDHNLCFRVADAEAKGLAEAVWDRSCSFCISSRAVTA